MSNIITATVSLDIVNRLPLTEIAERLIIDEATLNLACERMVLAAERILQRSLQEEYSWSTAECDLTTQQRLAVWLEAIEGL